LPVVMLGLVSAGFFTFYLLQASTVAQRIDPWTMLLYGFGAGSLLWGAFDVVSRTALPADWRIWAVMGLLGLIGTLVAHGLFVMALRTIRPSAAGIVATAEPVFAGLIAFYLFGDRLPGQRSRALRSHLGGAGRDGAALLGHPATAARRAPPAPATGGADRRGRHRGRDRGRTRSQVAERRPAEWPQVSGHPAGAS